MARSGGIACLRATRVRETRTRKSATKRHFRPARQGQADFVARAGDGSEIRFRAERRVDECGRRTWG